MRCVVCAGQVADPHYPNAWEKARKLFACCGDACVQKFDADVHWIPSVQPVQLDPAEEARMVRIAGERLRAGDSARIVTRDLLVAGAGLPAVRKALGDAERSAELTDQKVNRINALGWIAMLFGGRGRMAERRDKQDPSQIREAAATDVERWQARFGLIR